MKAEAILMSTHNIGFYEETMKMIFQLSSNMYLICSSGCLSSFSNIFIFFKCIKGEFPFTIYEPRCEKTGLQGFRPGSTQTRLYSYRRWLEAGNFVSKKKRDCTIRVAKTKTLINFAVTVKLICVFVFAYAKSRFSLNEAHM